MLFLGGCVENSAKYRRLVAQVDSLSAVSAGQNQELESIYADINDVTAGMQSLREAEHLLLLEAEKETKGSPSKQQLARLKNDVQAVTEAIAGYKSQIAKLENRTKSQSAEFKRMIANLNAELDVRAAKLDELTTRLAATNKELAMKVEEVKALVRDMDALDKVSKEQRMKIAEHGPVAAHRARTAWAPARRCVRRTSSRARAYSALPSSLRRHSKPTSSMWTPATSTPLS